MYQIKYRLGYLFDAVERTTDYEIGACDKIYSFNNPYNAIELSLILPQVKVRIP